MTFQLMKPKLVPPLDEAFCPAVLANHAFAQEVEAAGVPLVLGLERADGSVSRFETKVFPDYHPRAEANLIYAERLLKFLLWQRGAWKVYVGGPQSVGHYLKQSYVHEGARAFDFHFMGENVYQKTFTIIECAPVDVPAEKENEQALGRHLEGCRIGFDLGASDLKVSAVVEGQAIFSEEMVWEPRRRRPALSLPAHHGASPTGCPKNARVADWRQFRRSLYQQSAMVASLFGVSPKLL
jgi:hypothetical protein